MITAAHSTHRQQLQLSHDATITSGVGGAEAARTVSSNETFAYHYPDRVPWATEDDRARFHERRRQAGAARCSRVVVFVERLRLTPAIPAARISRPTRFALDGGVG